MTEMPPPPAETGLAPALQQAIHRRPAEATGHSNLIGYESKGFIIKVDLNYLIRLDMTLIIYPLNKST